MEEWLTLLWTRRSCWPCNWLEKMCIPDPGRTPPTLPDVVSDKLVLVKTSEREVKNILLKVDENKAVGPDNISPRLLRQCADELAGPLATLFNHCLQTSTWPESWKTSNVFPVHKKGGKSEVKNYRPVSLLSVISKVVETIVTSRITDHPEIPTCCTPGSLGSCRRDELLALSSCCPRS